MKRLSGCLSTWKKNLTESLKESEVFMSFLVGDALTKAEGCKRKLIANRSDFGRYLLLSEKC